MADRIQGGIGRMHYFFLRKIIYMYDVLSLFQINLDVDDRKMHSDSDLAGQKQAPAV